MERAESVLILGRSVPSLSVFETKGCSTSQTLGRCSILACRFFSLFQRVVNA